MVSLLSVTKIYIEVTFVEIRFNVALLRKLMNQKKLNQSKLAQHLNVDRSCVHKILNGERVPEARVLVGLIRVFPKHTVEDFLLIKNVSNQSPQVRAK